MAYNRVNKNRPQEISSKTPISVFRNTFGEKKKHCRDPRFDDLCGNFDPGVFEENYAFIRDLKNKEKEELEKELKDVGDDQNRKKQISYLLQRMQQQEKERNLLNKQNDKERKKQLEIMESAKDGIKPFIPKKSQEKRLRLVEKFQTLKKSGRLDAFLEKKRKKLFARERRRFYE